MQTLTARPPVEAEPCAICGTTGGYAPHTQCRPTRITGARFGIRGKLCKGCYQPRFLRAMRRQRRAKLELPELRTICEAFVEMDPLLIAPRTALVRAVKRLKEEMGLAPILTPSELDAVLPDGSSRPGVSHGAGVPVGGRGEG